ncbi:uncharacterized protein METZ01_LOCUS362586, partial [marine metagenome]
MKKRLYPWLALLTCPCLLFANPGKDAKDILAQSKVTGGLIVHLGCGTGDLLAELGKDERFLVHGLDQDNAKLKTARANISTQDYGRVSAERWVNPERHPYSDNLVNLLLIEDAG